MHGSVKVSCIAWIAISLIIILCKSKISISWSHIQNIKNNCWSIPIVTCTYKEIYHLVGRDTEVIFDHKDFFFWLLGKFLSCVGVFTFWIMFNFELKLWKNKNIEHMVLHFQLELH